MVSTLNWQKAKMNQGTFTDSNSLAQALLTKPEIYNTLAYSFGDKYFLQYLTAGSGRVSDKFKSLGNNEYTWPVMGDIIKPIQIAETVGTDKGRGGLPFQLKLKEKYFFTGCVVKFTSGIQARIQDDGYSDGSSFVYTFQLMSGDPKSYVPASDLNENMYVSFLYTSYEENSRESGSFEAYPMWFKNCMTTMRMQYGMSGSSATDIMVLTIGKENGEKSYLWMHAKEYQLMLQWEQMLEYNRWYGVTSKSANGNVNLTGKNGRPVITGDGVHRQIADVNKRNFSTLTTDFMEDFMIDMMVASKDADNKKFMIFTGIAGIKNFKNSILKNYTSYQTVDTTFTSKTKMGMVFDNSNWVTYKGILNMDLTVVHLPLYDDKTKHTAIDPTNGLPLESSRMTFLDFSDYGGEPNISLVTKGKGESRALNMWYTAGSTDPTGSTDSGVKKVLRSSSLDGFECYWLSEQGIKVTNPFACGELIKTVRS